MRESTQEEIDMEAQLAAARNLRSALEDKEQDAPFAEDEMREPTQEEIETRQTSLLQETYNTL